MSAVEELLQKARERVASRRRPESTYRLQFHAGFTFRAAQRIVPYLRDLGITHCYASPYLRARPGSTHGYDIIDHNSLNPEIGTSEDYDAFVGTLKEHGLRQVLDIVPNHMGVATNDNAWWNDVLENGPASRYAGFFDIAWRASPRPELRDKILIPTLGEPYGDILEKGQLQLAFENGTFTVSYYERRFPIAPRTYGKILGHRLEELEASLGADSPDLVEYQSILTAERHLPERVENAPERLAERQREKEVIKRRLATLARDSQPVREFIDENVKRFNGTPGDPHSFDLLDDLLNNQSYRLCFWRVASDEINYRRFFDINDLAALSMECKEVFDAAHALVFRLLAGGELDGVRIDHPDGLYDPAQYFQRLQEDYLLACARASYDAELRWHETDWKELEDPLRQRIAAGLKEHAPSERWPLYVVAEKILGASEPLPDDWPIDGTSGYDFVNMVNGVFIDSGAEQKFTRLYTDWIEDSTRFTEVVYRKKLLILQMSLASELYMLAYQLDRLAQKSRTSRDFTLDTLRHALREVIACFPVYRSYISDEGVHELDRKYVETAVRRAMVRNPLVNRRVFRFIRGMLLLEAPESYSAEDRAEQLRFVGKFQQVTAPVTAKGIEDTSFYIYNRLISLNEVGGEPAHFGTHPDVFHAFNRDRQARWPYSLSPLSTHDTKRSEDVRARINVLSEMPEDWRAALERWSRFNEPHRQKLDERTVPDANEEYLLYQSLLGAWPLENLSPEGHAEFVKRIQAYMQKALHEAKVHTSWINPDVDYDKAVEEFISRVLDEKANVPFLVDFKAFQRRISHYGLFNSLAQTLLRITAPGVPDTYQGTELWDFSLVDPDNRRPVDYERRARMLKDLQQAAANTRLPDLVRELVGTREDGRIKLYVTYRALHCRRERPGLFSAGDYRPLGAAGARADHLFTFFRQAGDAQAVVVVPRLLVGLIPDAKQPPLGEAVWQDTQLFLPKVDTGVRWRNVFTDELLVPAEQKDRLSLRAADVFAHAPLALLVGEREG
jgi:(1->4)-alpha-D-glucan 1-alpha-D-glucosylmutase